MTIKVDRYLGYLDKEMTIMGVLSAFSVGVPGLVINKLAGSGKDSALRAIWNTQEGMVILGSLSFLVAALYFYRERSLLAWFYGQLSLSESRGERPESRADLLLEADSWSTWIHYRWGFLALHLGFLLYSLALAANRFSWVESMESILALSSAATAILLAAFYRHVLTRYAYCDYPFRRGLFLKPPDDCPCKGRCEE